MMKPKGKKRRGAFFANLKKPRPASHGLFTRGLVPGEKTISYEAVNRLRLKTWEPDGTFPRFIKLGSAHLSAYS